MPKQDYDAPCRPEDDKADQMEVALLDESLKEPTSDGSIANEQAAGSGTEPEPQYGDNAAEPTLQSHRQLKQTMVIMSGAANSKRQKGWKLWKAVTMKKSEKLVAGEIKSPSAAFKPSQLLQADHFSGIESPSVSISIDVSNICLLVL